jgi:hypothetical protein
MRLSGTDIFIERDMGARPFSRSSYCRWRDWPFPSGLHWGEALRWWVEEEGEFQDNFETFCEAYNEASERR